MTRRGLVGLAVVLVALGADARAQDDFSADRIKAHVTFLADDLLEGREAGTRGHELAATYIASQFSLLGLTPGGADGGYFQPVDLVESTLTGRKPTVRLTGPMGTRTFTHGQTMVMRAPFAAGAVKVKAPTVFAGYGMTDAAVGFDDYAGLDVRGKIVVVLYGSPRGMDSEVGAHLQSEQARVAAEHGAVAVLGVQTRLYAGAVTFEQFIGFVGDSATTWVRRDGTPNDPSHGLSAFGLVESRAAAALFDGAPRSLEQVLDEADKPGGRPKGFALKTHAEIAAAVRTRKYRSPTVIGIIEGSDPALRQEYVALMGHADHIGLKKEPSVDRINNGALDNAAGVATLIEVARALSSGATRQRRSILVVANTAEEKGLLGAEYFAHNPTVPISRIVAAIDLDMPMLLYDFTDVVAYGASHSTLDEVFSRAGGAVGVALSPDPMPEQAVFVRSDHYAMVKAGVPAVMLATGMANGGQAAWSTFLANTYHQPSDDLAQPIVWAAGSKFARLNYEVVRALANADDAPRWYANDYFGNRFAPSAPKVDRRRAH